MAEDTTTTTHPTSTTGYEGAKAGHFPSERSADFDLFTTAKRLRTRAAGEMRDAAADLRDLAELASEPLAKRLSELAAAFSNTAEEINSLAAGKADELDRLRADHATELEQLRADHATELEQLRADHAAELEQLRADHAAELERIVETIKAELP